MEKYLSATEAIEELKKGTKLEVFYDEELWIPLFKESPIYLLWEGKIRIRKG